MLKQMMVMVVTAFVGVSAFATEEPNPKDCKVLKAQYEESYKKSSDDEFEISIAELGDKVEGKQIATCDSGRMILVYTEVEPT